MAVPAVIDNTTINCNYEWKIVKEGTKLVQQIRNNS